MDLMMPEMDGLETVARIRANAAFAQVPVLLLSSADRAGYSARSSSLGIARSLLKPVKQSDLLEAIGAAIAAAPSVETSRRNEVPMDEPVAVERCRVLLAEDGVINQQVAVRLLEERGHSVVVVNNGRAAVERVAEQPFDVVLMDVQMPEMDGIEATAAIRRAEAQTGGHIPIIAMTAHAMKGDRDRFLAAGMDGYVAKPVRPHELYVAVEGGDPHAEAELPADLPFEWDAALENVGGDEAMLRELAEMFFAECPKLMQQIREHIAGADGPELRRAAHTLKGSAHVFGAEEVAAAAHRLEEIGGLREEAFADAEEALALLEDEVTRLLPALRERVAASA